MYQEINRTAYINGDKGIYDGRIKNHSVRYARNAVDNYKQTYSPDAQWLKEKMPTGLPQKIDKDTFDKSIKQTDEWIERTKDFLAVDFPPIKFNMKYAKNAPGEPDKLAVMGVAYEEMDKRTSMPVDELTKKIDIAGCSADSLDLNGDGNIDLAEYGSSILVEDMLSSSDSDILKAEDITGEINDKGQVRLMSFAAIKNYRDSQQTYKDVYNAFNLADAQKEFLKDKNNLI